jgi:hypothetical protein
METAQRTADFCDISRSLTATTAALKKAQKAAMMSSPRYVSASEEIMASGVGTLGTRTTTFGVSFTITLLSLGGEESGSSPRYYIQRGQEPSGRSVTAGLPLTQERRAGPIARVPIVSIPTWRFNMAAAPHGV